VDSGGGIDKRTVGVSIAIMIKNLLQQPTEKVFASCQRTTGRHHHGAGGRHL